MTTETRTSGYRVELHITKGDDTLTRTVLTERGDKAENVAVAMLGTATSDGIIHTAVIHEYQPDGTTTVISEWEY